MLQIGESFWVHHHNLASSIVPLDKLAGVGFQQLAYRVFGSDMFLGRRRGKGIEPAHQLDGGLLIIHPEIPSDDWDYIRSSEIPFVVLHFKPRSYDYSWMDYLFTDHVQGGYMATETLIDSGCRNILTLREDSREIQYIERTKGYRQALEAHTIPFKEELVVGGDCSFEFGFDTIMARRDSLFEIDGIFAQADLVALGAIEALKELEIEIPGRMRVIGYDDTELGKYFRPKLTTVHQPREEHARLACERLINLLDGVEVKPPMQEILSPLMVYRETC